MNATIEDLLARLEQLEARVDEHSLFPGASADVLFLLVASLNVFFMQCGFGMLEAGSVTSRSTQAILLKNLLDACLSAFIWWVVGHGIAFDGTNDFIGTAGSDMSSFFLSGYGAGPDSGYHRVFWWFQWTFAAAAGTIVSGAVAERAQLLAYLAYTFILTAVIYPIIVHWCWSEAGRGDPPPLTPPPPPLPPPPQPPPTPPFTPRYAPRRRIVVNTTLSAAGSGLVSLAIATLGQWRRGTVPAICNGILAGLVSITAGCATVHPWAALVIGMIGGLVYRGCSHCVLHKLKVDDPLDSSSVHGACGAWGVIAAALLTTEEFAAAAGYQRRAGLFYGGGKLLGAALLQMVCILAWSGTNAGLVFLLLKKAGKLRRRETYMAAAPEEDLDSSIHGGAPLEPAEHGSGNTSRAESVDTSDPVIEMPDATPDKDQPAA
ncbi:putative ammonium transporter [Emiliania huxleyi CCMP1516]|uniref:Ammonium transporter AmtB-like domain-containing protein n=2 Tax=Emiliania huxleyi TaxID=2903 RepID=A0A0D3L031_EMIH1|nr:putative ammonium transporter [Emiliania huxleyi CCMP1516]EOD41366.1 putative ammonium transporter [Emiliania huxleyi CCMP1516]|eukprot:XP_005793795.1 putative ammonium transporter [Emiliania huxleyi CCMP1516]